MKKIYIVSLIAIYSCFQLNAQIEYSYSGNNANHTCITAEEYKAIEAACNRNVLKLGLDKSTAALTPPTLIWPVRLASGITDCGFHFIGAYVDQVTATTTIGDFNCGTNTYDGHHGTDIAIFPYGFVKMDNKQVEVVAAAAGTIIQRAEGHFDRNCTKNTDTANSIIIQHADGSRALYWHMRKNSITAKKVGETVTAGEYLGCVGSSGSSSGPHLHFEVWTGSTGATYNDPFYTGSCNKLNSFSWWASQKPYTDPQLVKVSVNTTDAVFPGCPNTETPNEANTFAQPFTGPNLSPGYAKFYIFLRDVTASSTVDLKILNPDNSTFNSWVYNATTYYKNSYYHFSKLLPKLAGTYKFQATYNGNTCEKVFTVTTGTSGIPTLSEKNVFNVFPNPVFDEFEISAEDMMDGIYPVTLIDVTGKSVILDHFVVKGNTGLKMLSISGFQKGVYFLTIGNGIGKMSKKIIIN